MVWKVIVVFVLFGYMVCNIGISYVILVVVVGVVSSIYVVEVVVEDRVEVKFEGE